MVSEVTTSKIHGQSVELSQRTGQTFSDILKHMLNNTSNSRPPKMELTGMLIPQRKWINGQCCRFKLATDSKEYFLRLSDALTPAAKKAAWEEVTIKGYFNIETNVVDVEKITLTQSAERYAVPIIFDRSSDLSFFDRAINQIGWIEPAPDYLAS